MTNNFTLNETDDVAVQKTDALSRGQKTSEAFKTVLVFLWSESVDELKPGKPHE